MNVIRSVTRNGRSIVLTAILALILVYFFSIVGFLFFKDDFLMETESSKTIRMCGLLLQKVSHYDIILFFWEWNSWELARDYVWERISNCISPCIS